MTTVVPFPLRRRRHLVIAGIGCAGSRFLLELLTDLGLDTACSRPDAMRRLVTAADGHGSDDVRLPSCPYVALDHRFADHAEEVFARGDLVVQRLIIPVQRAPALWSDDDSPRRPEPAAARWPLAARLARSVRLDAMSRLWAPMASRRVRIPALPVDDLQARQAQRLFNLVQAAAAAEVPITIVQFPRMVRDGAYLYRLLQPVLREVDEASFQQAFDSMVGPLPSRIARDTLDFPGVGSLHCRVSVLRPRVQADPHGRGWENVMRLKMALAALATGLSMLVLISCGGGGTEDTASTGTSVFTSSGAVTAFGSVYVNGRRFATAKAKVMDDDTGAVLSAASALEVGMLVDVRARRLATGDEAEMLHLHPLARGVVDASDTEAGTLQVMGQTVQVTASTLFSDRRACVSASSSPCTALAAQADLAATAGSGSTATAGAYVTVHGYLFDSGANGTNIVATLVSVGDLPSGNAAAAYKAEGIVNAVGSSSITIGGLSVDLSKSVCRNAGQTVACASAFSTGQVVSAFAAAAPALPATALMADAARAVPAAVVEVAGETVELEGKVSALTTAPAGFTLRGLRVDTGGLGSSAPVLAAGDLVRANGTLASDGKSMAATSVTVLRAAVSRSFGFIGEVSNVVPGTSTDTYTVNILGQTVTVNAATRMADRQSGSWVSTDPAANPFNITTFSTYFAASASKQVRLKATADPNGALTATSFVIVPNSTVVSLGGPVDATPAPVNSSTTGAPSTFSIHGVAVSADPASIFRRTRGLTASSTPVTIAAGEIVFVHGTLSSGTIVVGPTPAAGNAVVDLGLPSDRDRTGL